MLHELLGMCWHTHDPCCFASHLTTCAQHSRIFHFHRDLGACRWQKHVTMVVRGGIRIAQFLAEGEPVLVHCSDGWDRTSQLSALAQLILDPYYRTIDGFSALIEKDW